MVLKLPSRRSAIEALSRWDQQMKVSEVSAVEGGVMSRKWLYRNYFLVAALLFFAVGVAFRVYHLGDRSLWFDEALTADMSRGTLTRMLEQQRAHGSAPVVHALILYLVQKWGTSPVAVRVPSVLASLLAILLMLAMVRAKVSNNAALISAAILAISVSQIRYAQEVREYSLSILLATILVFCLLKWESADSRSGHPIALYAALFLAPLVQYGLIFLAFGILATIGLRLTLASDTRFRLSHLVVASAFLGAGGLLSFVLTLHYQFHAHTRTVWYLADYYFDPQRRSLWKFLGDNSYGLLSFFMPGRVITLCFVVAASVFCIAQVRSRKCDPLTVLVLSSLLLTACAALVKYYPYGGVRQCLFLSPVLILFAGVVFDSFLRGLRGSLQMAAIAGLGAVILVSGERNVLRERPYGEIEDIVSVLRELDRSSATNDQVWVNHDAVPAVEFYLGKGTIDSSLEGFTRTLRNTYRSCSRRLIDILIGFGLSFPTLSRRAIILRSS